MDTFKQMIGMLMTFFKILVSVLAMLDVSDEAEREALDTMFDEINNAVNGTTEAATEA
ncbi:MAG: hypothetical protein IKN72_12305 [Clostridia bacterium]|nr:hypothetical protein [Clostridia bacterium]MBR3554149.1 hypothetical protein [Clostridia bacterium]